MSLIIHPRTPPEKMDGWIRLSRYVEKIRLRLAGRLHRDHEATWGIEPLGRHWLQAAGLGREQMITVGRTFADGAISDWSQQLVKQSRRKRWRIAQRPLVILPSPMRPARLTCRNATPGSGRSSRAIFQTFVDYFKAVESRR